MCLRRRSSSSVAAAQARRQEREQHDALVASGPVLRVELPPDVQGGLRRFVHESIKTVSSYESLLRSNLDKLGFERTQVGLLAFLTNGPYPGKAPGTVLKLGYALKWHCKKENQYLHPWLTDLIKTTTTGYYALYEKENHGITKLSGAVTAPMMEQLLTSMGRDAPSWARDGVVLQWAFSLRGHQVADVQYRNIKRVRGDWVLTLPKDKQSYKQGLQGKYQDQHETHKIIPVKRARETIDRMMAALKAQNAPGDTPLVDVYNVLFLNKEIKAAALAYGWSTEFIAFRGCHCLRHGGAYEGRLACEVRLGAPGGGARGAPKYEQVCDGAREYTFHRGHISIQNYMRSNDERNASGLAAKQKKELERKGNKLENLRKATEGVTDFEEIVELLDKVLEEADETAGPQYALTAKENAEMRQLCNDLDIILKEEEARAKQEQAKRKTQTRAGGAASAGPAKPKAKQAAKEAPRQAGRRRQRSEDDE